MHIEPASQYFPPPQSSAPGGIDRRLLPLLLRLGQGMMRFGMAPAWSWACVRFCDPHELEKVA
jgi:hypothetical protein